MANMHENPSLSKLTTRARLAEDAKRFREHYGLQKSPVHAMTLMLRPVPRC